MLTSASLGDPLLLQRAQAGDSAALEAVLQLVQPDLRRYARRTCKASEVEDAVQEALIILHRKLGSLRNLGALAGWLMAVVSRECFRLARRMMSREGSLEALEADLDFAHHPQEELRLDLARALESLPEHYRAVILLRDVEELTIDELAHRLALTRESAKARLHRARKMVREYFQA